MPAHEYRRTVSQPLPMARRIVEPHVLRRIFRNVCAAAGLIVLVPIFTIMAVAIKLDDGGPVFYFQSRVGKGLRKFRLLKFRSMFANCAEGVSRWRPGTRVSRELGVFCVDINWMSCRRS